MNKALLQAILAEYDQNKTPWRRALDLLFGIGYSRSPAIQALANFVASLSPETTELSSEQIARLRTEVTDLYPARLATGAATRNALAQATVFELVIDPAVTQRFTDDFIVRREMEARLRHSAQATLRTTAFNSRVISDRLTAPPLEALPLDLPAIGAEARSIATRLTAESDAIRARIEAFHATTAPRIPFGLFDIDRFLPNPVLGADEVREFTELCFSTEIKRELGKRVLTAIDCILPEDVEYGTYDAFYEAIGDIITQHYVYERPANSLSLNESYLATLKNHFQKQLDASTALLAERRRLADPEVIPHLLTQLQEYHPLAFYELSLEVISTLDPAVADRAKQAERTVLQSQITRFAEQIRSGTRPDDIEGLMAIKTKCNAMLSKTSFTERIHYAGAPEPSAAPGMG